MAIIPTFLMGTQDHLLRTWLDIQYESNDITADAAADLIAFEYVDNDGGAVDDLSITLQDTGGKWSGPWLPARGDTITVTLLQAGRGAGFPLPCGTFTVDDIGVSGPPAVVTIKAIGIPANDDVRQRARSRAWENVRLQTIAQDVSAAGEMALLWLPELDPLLDRRDQSEESDLAFLERLCKDEGWKVKVNNQQLIVYDPEKLAQEDPIVTITVGVDDVKRYDFSAKTHDVYSKCTIEYQDPKDGKVKTYTYTNEEFQKSRENLGKKIDGTNKAGRGKNGKTLKLVRRVPSQAEAERQAKAALAEANRGEITGSLEIVGDTRLVTGASVRVLGVGAWDGKYFIRRTTHNVGGQQGYSTSIELSNTNLDTSSTEDGAAEAGEVGSGEE